MVENNNKAFNKTKDSPNQKNVDIDSIFKNKKDNESIDKNLVKNILKDKKREQKNIKKLEEKNRKSKIKQLIKAKKLEEKQIKKKQEETIKEIEKKGKIASWFRLDNAASIYPSASSRDWNFVYRISATMKDKVDKDVLQLALDDIMPRFPSFNVRLCHGFFWNYQERNFNRLKVEKEKDFPCKPFNLNDDSSFLIRVLYSEYNIIFEAFHAISDGRGSLFFFNSLIARYLERKGVVIEKYEGCANYLDIPSEEEIEDSFFVKATKEKIKRPKEQPAYKIKGNLLPSGTVNTVEGVMSVSELKSVAKSYGVKLSVFLCAVVGYCVYKKQRSFKKPTRISVPIDLRTRFNSKTLRNFSSYINITVAGKDLTFEDVINIFKEKLENIDNKFLQANINANVNIQKNIFVKLLPLFIKNVILKTCFNYLGENYQTLAFSNIGRVNVPEVFNDYIDSYSVNLGRSKHNQKSIGVVSFNDKLNICISSKLYETETERDIFRFLSSLGIKVTVYSNRRDLYGRR